MITTVPSVLLDAHNEHEFVGYCVFDQVSGLYGLPTFYRHPVDAIRAFESAAIAQDVAGEGLLATHPQDFIYCAVCGYNTQTSTVFPFDVPIRIQRADEVL